MKNFDWTQFSRKIAIKANLDKIYEAWTVPNEIEKWFLSSTNYYNSEGKVLDRQNLVKEGDLYEWSWFLYDAVEKGKITKANGKDYLQFTFAGDCLVDVQLTKKEEYIIVELTQKNIPTDDDSKENVRLGCDSGWAFYLVNLKSVYEGGLDLRNKEDKLKGMLNN